MTKGIKQIMSAEEVDEGHVAVPIHELEMYNTKNITIPTVLPFLLPYHSCTLTTSWAIIWIVSTRNTTTQAEALSPRGQQKRSLGLLVGRTASPVDEADAASSRRRGSGGYCQDTGMAPGTADL